MKSNAKKQYVKWPSRENNLAFKKARYICSSINKRVKKDYFKEATKYGVMINKEVKNKTISHK